MPVSLFPNNPLCVVVIRLIALMGSLFTSSILVIGMWGGSCRAEETSDDWGALTQQAYALYDQEQYGDAALIAEQAVAVAEQAFEPSHPNVGSPLIILGLSYTALGRFPDAKNALYRALALYESQRGPEHGIAMSLNSLAELASAQGDEEEARDFSEKALPYWETTLRQTEALTGPTSPHVAEMLEEYARALRRAGRADDAEAAAATAKRIRHQASVR